MGRRRLLHGMRVVPRGEASRPREEKRDMSAALLADQAVWAARPGCCWSAGCRPADSVGGAIGSHDGVDFACAQHTAQLRFVENGGVEVAVIFAGADSVDAVENLAIAHLARL